MAHKEYIKDLITGKQILKTPEEINRQGIIKILHEDYNYPLSLMVKEFGVKKSPSDVKRSVPVDVAIFEGTKDLKNKKPKIFIETKKDNYNLGKEQLKDYMTFERDVAYGIWYNGHNENGQTIAYFKKYFKDGTPKFEEISDVPKYGFNSVNEQIKYSDLKPTSNLKVIFKNLRGFLAANSTGTTRDEIILEQLSMIIITKLYDEKYAEDTYVKFRVIEDNPKKTSKAINQLYNEAKTRWNDVFTQDDEITLDDDVLMKVVAQLQHYSLMNSNRNVISEAFESIISYATKGSQGQFFTPENVAHLMVEIANPTESTTVFDPASGTAGFLTTSMFHVWNQIQQTKMRDDAKKDKEQQYATNNLFGIEKDSFLAKISKAFMAVLGDGRAGIFVEDSLKENNWKIATQAKIKDKKFNIILTNPPFGKDIKLSPETKKNFEFGNKIELAFIEMSLRYLEKGGILGVILPETVFHAPKARQIREKLFYKNNITHIIDLPHDTFRPYNNAKTDIIFLRKGEKQQEFVTGIKIDEIGHDHTGKAKYKFNPHTFSFTDEIADDIPNIINSLKNDASSKYIKKIPFSEIKEKDMLVARPYFELNNSSKQITLGELCDKNVIKSFDGHGSPSSYLKGLGTNPYIRVKDIVNLEIAHNRLDDIPDKEYDRLYSPEKALQEKDIVFVRRGSYRIGDVGILYKKDLHSILTREILILRVLNNDLGITPFNLLGLLNSQDVRKQLNNLILMDTTLPNIGDRWRDIRIDISNKAELLNLSKQIQEMYNTRCKFWNEYSKLFGNE